MKEITKFFGISLTIVFSILTILIGSYSVLNAESKELNLIGFCLCNTNNSKMAI